MQEDNNIEDEYNVFSENHSDDIYEEEQIYNIDYIKLLPLIFYDKKNKQ